MPRDLIGDTQHGSAPGKDFVAQECVAAVAPLSGIPG